MTRTQLELCALVAAAGAAGAANATEVAVCTDQGRFTIELADEQAPLHVANFLAYVDAGFYSGIVFHRVVPGFMVQAGGFDRDLKPRPPGLPPVVNESKNGLSNLRSTVAAARSDEPNSATAQFFINVEDNAALDGSPDRWGYTVFGRVKEGMPVVDRISQLPTGSAGSLSKDVPQPLVTIDSIARLDSTALSTIPEASRESAIKHEISTAYESKNYARALQWVDHYRAACGGADSEISLAEARSALAVAQHERALFALEDLLGSSDADDPRRAEALELYAAVNAELRANVEALVQGCDVPAAPPEIPDGSTATMEQMLAAQTGVRDFVTNSEAYLECVTRIIDDEKRPAEERSAATREHNRAVGVMEQLAESFNVQVRAYKAHE